MMKKLIASCFAALCLVGAASANTGGAPWDKFPTEKVTDVAALQHGAKLFVNYCLNCHGASFMRYNRLHDIGLTDAQIKDNMLDRKSTRLNSSHIPLSRMPSSA